jgi:hypothetical protein
MTPGQITTKKNDSADALHVTWNEPDGLAPLDETHILVRFRSRLR